MKQRSCFANYLKVILTVVFCTTWVLQLVLSYCRIMYKVVRLFGIVEWLLFLSEIVLPDNRNNVQSFPVPLSPGNVMAYALKNEQITLRCRYAILRLFGCLTKHLCDSRRCSKLKFDASRKMSSNLVSRQQTPSLSLSENGA